MVPCAARRRTVSTETGATGPRNGTKGTRDWSELASPWLQCALQTARSVPSPWSVQSECSATVSAWVLAFADHSQSACNASNICDHSNAVIAKSEIRENRRWWRRIRCMLLTLVSCAMQDLDQDQLHVTCAGAEGSRYPCRDFLGATMSTTLGPAASTTRELSRVTTPS